MKQKNVILMVVAVGCGLAAAVLTSQMSGKGAQTETVEVVVAAKDLPVGTFLTKDELKTAVKRKRVPKDGLPPAFVQDEIELQDKRLSRGIRAEETFNPKDLTKGGVVTLPPGMNMISLSIGVSQAVAGFVGPGSRVDVLATLRLGNQLKAFPLMVNMLVLAVDTNTSYDGGNGVFPNMSTVSFAVDRRQALLLALAKTRGCNLELMLRNQESNKDEAYSIEEVEKLLTMAGDGAKIYDKKGEDGGNGTPPKEIDPINPKRGGTDTLPLENPNPVATGPKPVVDSGPGAAPKVELVRVPVAVKNIDPGTKLTNDLIKESFVEKEFRKGDAEEALSIDDLRKLAADEKALTNGLGKGQWVTGEVIGDPKIKPTQKLVFEPKEGPPAEVNPAPIRPIEPAVKRATRDIVLHTASGSRVFTYEEVRPDEWRLVGDRPLTASRPQQEADAEPAPKKND